MGLCPLGDSAWMFISGAADRGHSLQLILRLRRLIGLNMIPQIHDVVSSFDTIAVHFDPSDGEMVLDHLTSLDLDQACDADAVRGYTITVPVVYGGDYGPDLQTLADARSLTAADVARIHSEAEYTVAAIGFAPGFPYLYGLPEILHHPRRPSPRSVPAGSVAIAGDQAGIYPFASQGGWHVLGRTPLQLFDPHREDPSLLHPGDKVKFVTVDRWEAQDAVSPGDPATSGDIRILEPGALSSIQAGPRLGFQRFGVSPGGAADPVAACVANRLVGNPEDAALLECTMTGALLLFEQSAKVAWVGWKHESAGKPHELKAGSRLDLRGPMSHLRGYLAVAGGFDVPSLMGSCATDLRSHFGGHGGRALRSGDWLHIGKTPEQPRPDSGSWRVSWPRSEGYLTELRYVRGVQADWFCAEAHQALQQSFYEISPASDRMGCRLKGEKLQLIEPRDMVSQPVVAGSIQVPPDGQPIVLLCERQTIGGYPQIGHVISADLPKLARAWPGTRIHFREVDLDEARRAWAALRGEIGTLAAGLMGKS